MSLSKVSGVEKENPLNIHEILADFFLRKIDMPSHSDDSDHKHKSKKKKSKHKRRKHKKSKHRHRSSSSDTSSRTSDLNNKVVDDVSSSEEMGIKRLKKIKSLKLQSTCNSAVQSVECDKKETDTSNTSTSEKPIFYGPSIELLLSGVDSNNSSSKANSAEIISSEEKENVHCTSDLNVTDNSKEDKASECLTEKPENETLVDSVAFNTTEPEAKKNSHDTKNNDKSSLVSSSVVNDSKNCAQTVAPLEGMQTDVQKEPPSEKSVINDESSKNKGSKTDTSNSNSSIKAEKEKHSRKKKHSKSRSRSRSQSRHTPPKLKHKRRTSRSSSRDSYYTSKRKRYSRSHSRGREHERRRKSHSRSRSRSKYQRHRRSHSPYERYNPRRPRSRSRSYTRHRRQSRSTRRNSKSRQRDRSSSKSRYRKKSKRSESRSRSKSKSKSRNRSPSKEKPRSRSKEKKSSQSSTKIDQAKVLETARKNVLKMMKSGTLPEGLPVENLKKEQLISIQAGGKSVQELTDFCQRLSQKENEPDVSENEDNEEKTDDATGFIHHPFKVKEPGMIKLNIKNAVQLPIKTHAQKIAETTRLSSQFPVSSGNQHKQKELEWVPVVPGSSKTETKPAETVASSSADVSKAVVPLDIPVPALPPPPPPPVTISYPCPPAIKVPPVEVTTPVSTPVMMPPPMATLSMPPPMPPPSEQPTMFYQMPIQPVMETYVTSNQPMSVPYSAGGLQPQSSSSPVFKPPKKLDIPAIVSKRFQALTKLQENPNDPEALRTLQEAQESIQDWVESQQVPGLFTGSTDAKILSAAELCGPFKYYKPRKDILSHAPPVTEGKGMSLLKKMGWNPGEGLGKNKEGSLEPLVLDIKTDKKGLVSEGENSKKGISSFMKELQGKHPVSALMELCSKRRWKPPLYSCVLDHGPPHKKVFCFKVEVNGVEYQPLNPSTNKKIAKADAAVLALQSLNIVPKGS